MAALNRILVVLCFLFFSCQQQKQSEAIKAEEIQKLPEKSMAQIKSELEGKGFQIFDFVDKETKDTILMQQYFMAFLKNGPNREQSKPELDSLQILHH